MRSCSSDRAPVTRESKSSTQYFVGIIPGSVAVFRKQCVPNRERLARVMSRVGLENHGVGTSRRGVNDRREPPAMAR